MDFTHHLIEGKCIRLLCDGPERHNYQLGYVGEVREDEFQFGIVTNSFEHFSNISDPPILKFSWIRISDVKDIRE